MKRTHLAAAASLGALVLLGWLWSSAASKPPAYVVEGEEVPNFGKSRVEGARRLPPLEEIRFADGAPSVSFFAIGDTGYAGEILHANVRSMQRRAERQPVAFVLLLGDNFYPEGVGSTDDRLWREVFEQPFADLAVPFHAVLGNHDHRGRYGAQIEYTKKSERWRMPARWYTFSVPVKGGLEAQFFALDTQPIHRGWAEAKEEQDWLETELGTSKARWKIVFGHHPILSHGSHGETAELLARVAPILERHEVDLVVSGHDHDLQILRAKKGWIQVVSGAGSSTRDSEWDEDTLCALAEPGYAWIGIGAKELWIEIATAREGAQFRHRIAKD